MSQIQRITGETKPFYKAGVGLYITLFSRNHNRTLFLFTSTY